jgi:hypothetical protein
MFVTIVRHNTLQALHEDDLSILLPGSVCPTVWTLKYVLLSFLHMYQYSPAILDI